MFQEIFLREQPASVMEPNMISPKSIYNIYLVCLKLLHQLNIKLNLFWNKVRVKRKVFVLAVVDKI